MSLKHPLILGFKGSIGSRYAAIFKHLGVRFTGVDVYDHAPREGFDSVIIATPTHMHLEHVAHYSQFDVPILVEKPLATDLRDVQDACFGYEKLGTKIRMVNQYKYIDTTGSEGETYYNYFHSGRDGLYWDAISIIALARSNVIIDNVSPVWMLSLNGMVVTRDDVDKSYIEMIKDFLELPPTGAEVDYIMSAHEKVERLINA